MKKSVYRASQVKAVEFRGESFFVRCMKRRLGNREHKCTLEEEEGLGGGKKRKISARIGGGTKFSSNTAVEHKCFILRPRAVEELKLTSTPGQAKIYSRVSAFSELVGRVYKGPRPPQKSTLSQKKGFCKSWKCRGGGYLRVIVNFFPLKFPLQSLRIFLFLNVLFSLFRKDVCTVFFYSVQSISLFCQGFSFSSVAFLNRVVLLLITLVDQSIFDLFK